MTRRDPRAADFDSYSARGAADDLGRYIVRGSITDINDPDLSVDMPVAGE